MEGRGRAIVRALADGGASLPADLKPTLVRTLGDLGLLSTPPRRGPAVWVPWASAALFAVLGFVVGRGASSVTPAPGEGAAYVLLLTGGASLTPEENAARRGEYGAWLRDIKRRGVSASGMELVGPRHELPRSGRNEPVVGYFIINARDEAEALTIASANPHLRHGGGVTLAGLR